MSQKSFVPQAAKSVSQALMSDTFWPQSDRGNVFTSQVFDLDHAVRILAFDQPRGLRVCVCISTLPAPSGTEDSPWDGRAAG